MVGAIAGPAGMMGGSDVEPRGGARQARVYGGTAALVLTAAAGLHLVWALSPWPLSTWRDWNRTVFCSDESTVRSGWGWAFLCLQIAGLLLAAAYVVGTRAGLLRRFGPWWVFRVGAVCVVLVLLSRGVLGFTVHVPEQLPGHRWNQFLYSPLCLGLAALSAAAVGRAGRYPRGREAAAGWFQRRPPEGRPASASWAGTA